ncbi:urea ABC transporter permease subunit UrtB [Sedimenticola hydrogenitrophicus]|uniref:urea ABC transporter permease subunit UrtB n=1 Tax=Sedimenticola hydrogenitrophicus TaxID=2967975 RepID=UPI0021A422F4|nr:urea ABC transporter permease subunit UrtB [Sedimenticola hydrogenitrophicus]
MEVFISQIFTGLSIASILLLVALGLAIIYGSMGVINLAHGEFVMLGAYATWFLQQYAGIGLIPSLVLVFLMVGSIGWVIERGIVRHLYHRPLDTILATWGIGIMLQQLVRLTAGAELRYVELPESLSRSVDLLGINFSVYRLFILLVTGLLILLTWLLLMRTEYGTKLRAITQNREMAECSGIDSQRIFGLTFAFGAGLAGVAGSLVAPIKSVSPDMGTHYVVDAFMVVVLGGVGSVAGTAAASGILGEVTAGMAYLLNDTLAKVIVFIAVVMLIRFRPQGLFSQLVRK